MRISLTLVLLLVTTVASYPSVRERMLDQSPFYMVTLSNVPANLLLLLFLWGLTIDKLTGRKTAKHGTAKTGKTGGLWGWVIWGIGLAVVLSAYRFLGGHVTRWG